MNYIRRRSADSGCVDFAEPPQAGIDMDEAEQAPSLSNSDESLGRSRSEEKKPQEGNSQKRLSSSQPASFRSQPAPPPVSSLHRGRCQSLTSFTTERSPSQSKQNPLGVGADVPLSPDHDSATSISPTSNSSNRKSKPWGLFRVLVPERSRSSSDLAVRMNLVKSHTTELPERSCREGLAQTRKSRTSELLDLPRHLLELDATGGHNAAAVTLPPPISKSLTLTKSLSHTSLRPLREARDRIAQATSFSFRRNSARDMVQSCRDLDLDCESSPLSPMQPLSPLSPPTQWGGGVDGAASSSSPLAGLSTHTMAPSPSYVPTPCFVSDAVGSMPNAVMTSGASESSARDWAPPALVPADGESSAALRIGLLVNSLSAEELGTQPAATLRSSGDSLLASSSHSASRRGERSAAQASAKANNLQASESPDSLNSSAVATSTLVMQVYRELEGAATLEQLQELGRNGTLEQIPRKAGGELSSVGSILHEKAQCSPCAYWFKGICKYGIGCTYCHYAHEGQKTKRLRASKQTRMRMKRRAEAQARLETPLESVSEPGRDEFDEESLDMSATDMMLPEGLSMHSTNWASHASNVGAMETGLLVHSNPGSILQTTPLPSNSLLDVAPPIALQYSHNTQRYQQDQWRPRRHHLDGRCLASVGHQSGPRPQYEPDFGPPPSIALMGVTSLGPPALSNSVAYVQPSFELTLTGTQASSTWEVPEPPVQSEWIRRSC